MTTLGAKTLRATDPPDMVRLAPSCALVSEVGPSLPEMASALKVSRKETRTREVIHASGTKLLSSHCRVVCKRSKRDVAPSLPLIYFVTNLLTCRVTASELPVSIAAGSVPL